MNAILLNQALADFGIAFFGNPVAFFNAVHGDWMLGQNYCFFYGFMMSLFGEFDLQLVTFSKSCKMKIHRSNCADRKGKTLLNFHFRFNSFLLEF